MAVLKGACATARLYWELRRDGQTKERSTPLGDHNRSKEVAWDIEEDTADCCSCSVQAAQHVQHAQAGLAGLQPIAHSGQHAVSPCCSMCPVCRQPSMPSVLRHPMHVQPNMPIMLRHTNALSAHHPCGPACAMGPACPACTSKPKCLQPAEWDQHAFSPACPACSTAFSPTYSHASRLDASSVRSAQHSQHPPHAPSAQYTQNRLACSMWPVCSQPSMPRVQSDQQGVNDG